MKVVLLDTHVWHWLFTGERPLPKAAVDVIEQADRACVCAISLYEIARKAQIGKWPGITPSALERLVRESQQAGLEIVSPGPAAMVLAGFLDWDHRDPWDRLIAATAIKGGAELVSADEAFDALPNLRRVWD